MAVAVSIWLAKWSKMDSHQQNQSSIINTYVYLVCGAVMASVLRAAVCYKVILFFC